MRASVDAILVIRRGGEQLDASVGAILSQTRLPETLVVVDLSADSGVSGQLDAALGGSPIPWQTITGTYGMTLAEAIEEVTAELTRDESPADTHWLWLLRDDTAPHPHALERLALTVEGAPLIRLAGPKQRMTQRPSVIREMGETMTRFGERIALAERELDQAQYDRMSDVLAVGESGMLMHTATLLDVEGFDPALSPLDGGLDLSIRFRLAGHRVVVVPRAIVEVGAGPADWHRGRPVSALAQTYLSRRAWLYRRFVYAPALVLIPLLLWAVPWSLLRGAWQVLAKHPDRIVAEVAAAFWALSRIADVLKARSIVSRHRVTSFATIDSLRLPPDEVRKRRGANKEAELAAREERELHAPKPPIFPALPWLVLALGALGGLIHGRWWGTEVLIGGGLLPLPATLQEAWAGVWLTTPVSVALDAPSLPSDPAQLLFASLASLTWWSPSLAIVGLFLVALPLAGMVAWWGASHFLSKAWTTGLVAGLWAVSPVFLSALGEGRMGAVIAHITLPWLVGSLLSAHESWQRVGQASIAALIVLAAAPVLWPAVLVGMIVLGLVRSGQYPLRMFVGVIPLVLAPSVILGFPRFGYWWQRVQGRWWDDWGVLFADPGPASAFVPGSWWELALGWLLGTAYLSQSLGSVGIAPASAAVIVLVLAVPAVVLAVISLTLGRIVAAATFAGLFVLGLLTATISGGMFSGYENFETVFVWPGAGVSLLTLGILVGAGATLDHTDFTDSLGNALSGVGPWLTRIAGLSVGAVALVGMMPFAVQTWLNQTPVQASPVARTLPAFVAAEAALNPLVGTLIIEQTDDGFRATIERGSGVTLTSTSTLVRGRSVGLTPRDEDIARLVATLVRPTAADPSETLQRYGIRFIVLDAPADSDAALTLAKRPELVAASAADDAQLWQVPDVVVAGPVDQVSPRSGTEQLFWGVLLIVGLLAVPTERRSRSGSRPHDDALPSLGEETADDV
jgi:GT2 family glycosyltransferase